MTTEIAQVVAIIGGVIVIVASSWRLASAILKMVRRWDSLMTEHEALLESNAANTKAILNLNKRTERLERRRGPRLPVHY